MSHTPKISAPKSTTSPNEELPQWDQYLRWLAPISAGILLAATAFMWWQGKNKAEQTTAATAYYEAAFPSEELSMTEQAEKLKEVASVFPDHASAPFALIQAASLLYNDGDYQGALDVCDEFLATYPTHPQKENPEWVRLHCQEVLGDLDAALAGYKAIATDDLLYPQAQLSIARIHEQKGEWAEAAAVYRKISEEFSGSPWGNQADVFIQYVELKLDKPDAE
jgi:outer membrane protein assembly factor BamD (BamD/ComL family)